MGWRRCQRNWQNESSEQEAAPTEKATQIYAQKTASAQMSCHWRKRKQKHSKNDRERLISTLRRLRGRHLWLSDANKIHLHGNRTIWSPCRLGDKHNEHTQKTAITVKVMAVRLIFMKQTGIISLRTCPRRSRNTAYGSRRRLSPADGWLPSLSWP